MAYIGNKIPANFQSLPAVQRFNGDGSDTTFILSAQIANDQSILVSVDGVTQDSNAYAVSGTTLTFTSAPSAGTGNIFVNTISPVGSTVVPPDGIAINASTGTFSGDVAMGVGSNITLDSSIGANSTTAFASMDGRIFYSNDYSDTPRGPNKVVLQNDNTWISGLGISSNSLDIYSGGDIKFNKSTSSTAYTKQVTILSGGGIAFNNDTAAANALDDYEEGTWTPAIYYQNSDDQTNSNNDIQAGKYTKIGNVVIATCYLKWDATNSRATDNIGVSGFPFTATAENVNAETRWLAPVLYRGTSISTANSQVMLLLHPNGTQGTFLTANGAANLGAVFGENNNMEVKFTLTYNVNT